MEKITAYICNPGNFGPEEIKGEWPCIPSSHLEWSTEPQELGIWVDSFDPKVGHGYYGNSSESGTQHKVAILVEPISLNPHQYSWVLDHQNNFDLIFSTYPDFGQDQTNPDKFKYFKGGARSYLYPTEWKVYPKTKDIVCVMSNKHYLEGHKLRHAIRAVYHHSGVIDYLNPAMDKKVDALKDYRFDLVIENESSPFFSEKLLDCMLAGCIPIYWTKDNNTEYFDGFNKNGIVFFQDEVELVNILEDQILNEQYYMDRLEAVKHNFEAAKKWASFGDVIWEAGLKELYT